MTFHRNRKWLAVLLAAMLLLACSVSAFAAAPSAKTSVGGYTLQKTEEAASTVTLRYKNSAGDQMAVTYTTAAKAAQQLGVRQLSNEPLLYACYSDDFDTNNLGTIYYTVGACTVTVRSLSSSGSALRLEKDKMLAFLEQLQTGPVPVATAICAQCGGDVYCQGAQVGAWKADSSSLCSHGGTVKYKDTQNQRSVTVTSVCDACGAKTEDSFTQSAVYCNFSGRWYMQSAR